MNMSPAEFVAHVSPHLPIGPYLACCVDCKFVQLIDEDSNYLVLFPHHIARLLLGAIVEECETRFAFEHRAQMGILRSCGFVMIVDDGENGTIGIPSVFDKLTAALSARAKAKAKEAT